MKSLRLTRITTHPKQGTFGALTIDGTPFSVDLEPSNMDNKKFLSCIPEGRYMIRPIVSPKFGKTWEVVDVPDRENIMFHAGNWAFNTDGCIILAQHFGKLHGRWAVLNSGNTFKAFLSTMDGEKEAELTIVNSY